MIKVNVLTDEKSWTKRLKKKEVFFNNLCKFFPKKFKFKKTIKNQNVIISIKKKKNYNLSELKNLNIRNSLISELNDIDK